MKKEEATRKNLIKKIWVGVRANATMHARVALGLVKVVDNRRLLGALALERRELPQRGERRTGAAHDVRRRGGGAGASAGSER